MPVTLSPVSRRGFLRGTVAGAAALVVGCSHFGRGGSKVDPDHFVLLSDTHVPGDKSYLHKTGIKPWDNLQQATTEVLELNSRPAAVLVCGDCACLKGLPEDYVSVVEGLQPLRQAGMPIHLALGNHDHRENFRKALPADDAAQDVQGRHTLLVKSAKANWLILDSLDETEKTPGVLGQGQLAWLARTLDANQEKPAMVFIHHNPDVKDKVSGLTDTKALMDVIGPRKQVKAYIFGHTHVWSHEDRDGLHLINLPPTAWLFDAKKPAGWVDVNLREEGAKVRLYSLDHKHAEHKRTLELKWR